MLLKHIYIYLNQDEYPKTLVVPFGFGTRYLCNFLERNLRTLKFKTEGFNKICVQGMRQPLIGCPIVPENAALPTVLFDLDEYERLKHNEHHEFYIRMLILGLKKCAQYHQIPLTEMMEIIEIFRRGGYRNEWVHQQRMFRSYGLQASLLCSLDSERFVLRLEISKSKKIVFERRILETKPDEIIFSHRYKEVCIEGDAVVVKDKFGDSVFSTDINSLI